MCPWVLEKLIGGTLAGKLTSGLELPPSPRGRSLPTLPAAFLAGAAGGALKGAVSRLGWLAMGGGAAAAFATTAGVGGSAGSGGLVEAAGPSVVVCLGGGDVRHIGPASCWNFLILCRWGLLDSELLHRTCGRVLSLKSC